MTQPSRSRRRILQGLSAASVASALPAFAFSSKGVGLFEQFDPLTGRVELLSQRGSQLQVAFHVQSLTAQHLMRAFQVETSFVEYADGRTKDLSVRIPRLLPDDRPVSRRYPPPTLNIMVSAGGEVELGVFTATLAPPHREHAMAHFRMRVGPQVLQTAPFAVTA